VGIEFKRAARVSRADSAKARKEGANVKKLISLIVEASLVVGPATLGLVVTFAYPVDAQQTNSEKVRKAKVVKSDGSKVYDPADKNGNKHDWGNGHAAIPQSHKIYAVTAPIDNSTGKRNQGSGNTTVNKNAGKKPLNTKNAKTTDTVNKKDKGNGGYIEQDSFAVGASRTNGTPSTGGKAGKVDVNEIKPGTSNDGTLNKNGTLNQKSTSSSFKKQTNTSKPAARK
jgi:hypothetical protein